MRGAPRVGAGARLGQAERARACARDARSGSHCALLLLGAEEPDRQRAERVVRRDRDRDRRVDPRQLLDGDRVGERVGAAAAVLLGDRHAHQPELGQLGDELVREALLAVELLGHRRDPLDARTAAPCRGAARARARGRSSSAPPSQIRLSLAASRVTDRTKFTFLRADSRVRGIPWPALWILTNTPSTRSGRRSTASSPSGSSSAATAPHEGDLEFNRRRLVRAQAQLSRLLLQRHLPGPAAA